MSSSNIHIILDFGHGSNTPGKCSPDKSFYEYKFNRAVGREIYDQLKELGYHVHRTWNGEEEPGSRPERMCSAEELNEALGIRVMRANGFCNTYGANNCILVSIHANAAGDGSKWLPARGFMSIVGGNASARSKRLASFIYKEAEAEGLQGNRSIPNDRYWVQNLAICTKTRCPAVLTESLFYDNKADLAILKSQKGRERIVSLHVKGIIKYIKSMQWYDY